MRSFCAIARNLALRHASPTDEQLTEAGEANFLPVAEIVLVTVEPEYRLAPQKSAIEGGGSKIGIGKVPNTESFRFFADQQAIERMMESLASAHAELVLLSGGPDEPEPEKVPPASSLILVG